jgi:hypothetical protein
MKKNRNSEMGSARLKFLVAMTIIIGGGYLGYQYIPVAFQAYQYKDLMQHYTEVAGAQGYKPGWAADQLAKSAVEYQIPPNLSITPGQKEGRVEVRVQYSVPIEMLPGGLWTYNYEFDHTARSTAFLVIK